MRLSELQKYILLAGYYEKNKFKRGGLVKFYDNKKNKPKQEDQVNIITKSIERLIDKELLIGYGVRTSHKWFIKEIKLTNQGRKQAKRLFGKQQELPFRRMAKNQ